MSIYNFKTGELQLSTKNGIHFALRLRPRITVIKGDSATGKTLLWKTVENIKYTEKDITIEQVATNIELINRHTDGAKVEQYLFSRGKLIIIDNADLLFRREHSYAENIVSSTGNHFLVFSRDIADLGVTPNHYGEFHVNEKTISIDYAYSIPGWL
jgi:predicted ATPase